MKLHKILRYQGWLWYDGENAEILDYQMAWYKVSSVVKIGGNGGIETMEDQIKVVYVTKNCLNMTSGQVWCKMGRYV